MQEIEDLILYTKERDRYLENCKVLYDFWEQYLRKEQFIKKMLRDSFKFIHSSNFAAVHGYGYSISRKMYPEKRNFVSVNCIKKENGKLNPDDPSPLPTQDIRQIPSADMVPIDSPRSSSLGSTGNARRMTRKQFREVVFAGSLDYDLKNFDLPINDDLYIAKYKHMVNNNSEDYEDREALFSFFQNNTISDKERRQLWKIRIGNQMRIDKDLFEVLKVRLRTEGVKPSVSKIITDDLARTLPNYKDYVIGQLMHDQLKALLEMFHLYRPDVGYVQGMTYLMVTFYYYFDEFETFVLFTNLVLTKDIIYHSYTFDMDSIAVYKSIFNRKIERKCPKVKEMLDKFMIRTEAFILDWMYTIYIRTFNIKIARVFWDIFLLFGDYYLLRVAYSIFALLKNDLAKSTNMENGLRYIRSKTGTLKLSKMVKLTLREVKTVSEIHKIYTHHREKVLAQPDQK